MFKICYWDDAAQEQRERDSTPEEDAQHEADIAAATPSLASVKSSLVEKVDVTIAAIYDRWMRFSSEYVEREAAARAFVAAGRTGDAGVWVTAFSSAAGMSASAAADLIISQADGLHSALQSLGALRMSKYAVMAAADAAAAQAAHDAIITQANAIAGAL
jgi:hypothetical protein